MTKVSYCVSFIAGTIRTFSMQLWIARTGSLAPSLKLKRAWLALAYWRHLYRITRRDAHFRYSPHSTLLSSIQQGASMLVELEQHQPMALKPSLGVQAHA
jgi:hypothetical protein